MEKELFPSASADLQRVARMDLMRLFEVWLSIVITANCSVKGQKLRPDMMQTGLYSFDLLGAWVLDTAGVM